MADFASRVKCVLGPTNTGKTHLAMERMLAHGSGIIGFPLRLLARENYERMVAIKGANHVALITGEEKIVPPAARWFSCTVEAMPLDRKVEFLAVDEIQLCADPDRGHIFTARLLAARGLVETMFLGAETIRPLVRRLVPEAEIKTRPRLSRLLYEGAVKLSHLAPRSAIVAFSAEEVYAIAEAIRRRRGGCAVVMGRMAPRTRNAQVALYQNREVDFLVATDAIGMGLNMDVDHVAFAGLGKFDGSRPRRLSAPELAQIAGRAGRGLRDGGFGTTARCPPLDEALITAIEGHRFEPLAQLYWRNTALDFTSPAALLASLQAPPPGPGLARGNEASDVTTLAALARDPALRALADRPARVALLWEAASIPDFRKLGDDTHARFAARVFAHLVRGERLPAAWIAGQIEALSRPEGDIDTLMQRLAGIRIWAYIAARPDWLADAAHWQARARAVEDLLSDALHERLTARFVDRRATQLLRRLDAGGGEALLSAVTAAGEVVVEGHAVGRMAGLRFVPDPRALGEQRRLVERAARRSLATEIGRRVARLTALPDSAFALTADHHVTWEGAPLARLLAGTNLARPRVMAVENDFVAGGLALRVRERAALYIERRIAADLAPLPALAAAAEAPMLRGIAHLLGEGLGIVPIEHMPEGEITAAVRARLARNGVCAGRFAVWLPAMLKPRAMALRAQLLALARGIETPPLPPPGAMAIAAPAPWPEALSLALGWLPAGPVLLRLDIAEAAIADLHRATRRGRCPLPAGLAGRLGVKAAMLPAVVRALGFRLIPATSLPADHAGPPAPSLVAARRPRPPRPAARPRPAAGPFAALAVLRHG